MDEYQFDVPATTAHLGPGFGVLGLALDLRFQITVRPTDLDGVVIERPSETSGSALDLRHDAILRGLHAARDRFRIKLPKGLTIVVEGDVPRGCGLGSNSADFAAGVGSALLFAKKLPPTTELIGLMVELGSDPGHGAAALVGGLAVAIQEADATRPNRFEVLEHPILDAWRLVIVAPEIRIGTADVHRVVPASLPHSVTARTSGRLVGVLRALAEGDEDLLHFCLADESHVPFRLGTAPGIAEALAAASIAGAAGATISGHGPAVIALTTHEDRVSKIRDAMRRAFTEAGLDSRTRTCQVGRIGVIRGNAGLPTA